MSPKIIMLIGFPASTKSTFAKGIQENVPSTVILSRDKEGGKIEDLLPKAEKALQEGHLVVLDNTHLTKQSRKIFIARPAKRKHECYD